MPSTATGTAAGRWRRPVNDVTPSRAAAPHRGCRPAPQPEGEAPPQSPSGGATCPLPFRQRNGPTALAAGRTPPDLTGPATCDFCSCMFQRPNAPPVTAIPPNGAFGDVSSPAAPSAIAARKPTALVGLQMLASDFDFTLARPPSRHRVSAGRSVMAIRPPWKEARQPADECVSVGYPARMRLCGRAMPSTA